MEKWTIVLAVVLTVLIIGLSGGVYFLQTKNAAKNQHNILYPFSAAISPGNTTTPIRNAAGSSQIDCSSVGGKINIVGAAVETIDPYGTCSGTATPSLN